MARRTTLNSVRTINEINLTPMMDLTFILLITFIITFPLIEQGIPVNLPTGEGDTIEVEEAVMITVDKQGAFYLGEEVLEPAELARRVKIESVANPNVSVLVRADEDIRYGKVVDVIQILRGANISKMALVNQSGKSVSGEELPK
ncbi:MAG: biopolymer transport protein ExbD [Kiritimatiellia bacterium]|jgi:biopolymer transport protein ExbD